MKDEELILEWNRLMNKKHTHQERTVDELKAFNKQIQESYDKGEITRQMMIKYAEIMCYLGE